MNDALTGRSEVVRASQPLNRSEAMSNDYHSVTLILENDLSEDEMQEFCRSLWWIRGVIKAVPNATDITLVMAHQRAKREISKKLWDALDKA